MKTSSLRRLVALLGYVSCLAAMPLAAQVGPIQPVMVLPDGKLEVTHDRPSFDEDYSVPVDVYVAADGTVTNVVVTDSSKNLNADAVAADYMRSRKFLPALDDKGQAVEGMAKVNVNMFKRGSKKVVRVTLKPPPMAVETERLRRMMCADFVWEVNRMQNEAGVRDASVETMPYISAHMYAQGKDMAGDVAEKFWDTWSKTLHKVMERCEKSPEKMYFTEVLVPALDGTMPTRETATAAAQ
ncbi:MAG TPA: energy transducer TonB [Steroidobacteraceae bacterium]|nr:energy transducer TonB [Steroidobacteraceae bacterium]